MTRLAEHEVNRVARDRQPSAEDLVRRAVAAQQQERWDEALGFWRAAIELHDEQPTLHASEMAVLVILGRAEEAEVLGATLATRFADSVDIAAQRLNAALGRGDWVTARARLEVLERDFAEHPFVTGRKNEVGERIRTELDALAEPSVVERSLAAEASADHDTAAAGWRTLIERDGANRTRLLSYGRALRAARQYERSEAVLAEAIAKFADDVEIGAHHAELAADQGNVAESARRWKALIERVPDLGGLAFIASTRLSSSGEHETAEAVLSRAIAADPERSDLRVQHAKLAEAQERWDLAVERWDVAQSLLPGDPNIRNARGDAIWQANAAKLEGGGTLAGDHPVDAEVPGDKELALAFEGLGDHCEFGIVQRRMGAEPIGLFRFAAISARVLTGLLNDDLAALGDASFIELGVTPNDEYLIRDTRGLYHMHCFVQRGSVDEARFLRQQITRLGYLKKKLIEDLETGEKVFVHKSSLSRISDAEAIALHDSVLRYGPNSVLVLRCDAGAGQAGEVELIRPGLMVGYLATPYDDHGASIDEAGWRRILPRAHAIARNWRRARAAGHVLGGDHDSMASAVKVS